MKKSVVIFLVLFVFCTSNKIISNLSYDDFEVKPNVFLRDNEYYFEYKIKNNNDSLTRWFVDYASKDGKLIFYTKVKLSYSEYKNIITKHLNKKELDIYYPKGEVYWLNPDGSLVSICK